MSTKKTHFSVDNFMVDSGIVNKSTADPEAMEILMERTALGFLKAGGQVTWDFWSELSVPSKAAFIRANEFMRAERVAQTTSTIVDGIKQAFDGFETSGFGLDSILQKAVSKIVEREACRAEGV